MTDKDNNQKNTENLAAKIAIGVDKNQNGRVSREEAKHFIERGPTIPTTEGIAESEQNLKDRLEDLAGIEDKGDLTSVLREMVKESIGHALNNTKFQRVDNGFLQGYSHEAGKRAFADKVADYFEQSLDKKFLLETASSVENDYRKAKKLEENIPDTSPLDKVAKEDLAEISDIRNRLSTLGLDSTKGDFVNALTLDDTRSAEQKAEAGNSVEKN